MSLLFAILPALLAFFAFALLYFCDSESSSPTTTTNQAVGDQGILSTGSGLIARDSGRILNLDVVVGGGGGDGHNRDGAAAASPVTYPVTSPVTYAEEGAVSVGGNLNTGLNLENISGTVTITGGAAELQTANENWLAALKDLGSQTTTANASILDKVIGAITGLAEGKQSEGASTLQKYGAAIAVAGLGLVAFVAWIVRKGH